MKHKNMKIHTQAGVYNITLNIIRDASARNYFKTQCTLLLMAFSRAIGFGAKMYIMWKIIRNAFAYTNYL